MVFFTCEASVCFCRDGCRVDVFVCEIGQNVDRHVAESETNSLVGSINLTAGQNLEVRGGRVRVRQDGEDVRDADGRLEELGVVVIERGLWMFRGDGKTIDLCQFDLDTTDDGMGERGGVDVIGLEVHDVRSDMGLGVEKNAGIGPKCWIKLGFQKSVQ